MLSKSINKKSLLLFTGLIAILFIPILNNSFDLWQSGSADNAFLADLIQEIATSGKPMSGIAYAVDQAFSKMYLVPPLAEDLCKLPFTESFAEKFNYFKWHTYFILYIIAPLTSLFPIQQLLPTINLFFHFCFLLSVLYFFMQKKVPLSLSVFAILIIFIHPAFFDGLQGQIYVDRWTYPLSFLYVYALTKVSKNYWYLLLLAIAISIFSDRFGVTVFLITLGYLGCEFLFQRNFSNLLKYWPLLLIGSACALFSIIIIKNYITHPSYADFGSQFSFASFKNNWSLSYFRENTRKFILLNFICLSPLLLFSRYTLIAIGLMLINILINIGGAEKIAYTTHYHSNYYPILIFAACDGLTNGYQKLKPNRLAALTFAIVSLIVITPYSSSSTKNFFGTIYDLPVYKIFKRSLLRTDKIAVEKMNEVRLQIPLNSQISIPEHLMPTFVLHSKINYFPLGLTTAHYSIVPNSIKNDSMLHMYRGPEEQVKAGVCLSERLKQTGYIEHFRNSSWIVFKK